jgi:hypothetical protein
MGSQDGRDQVEAAGSGRGRIARTLRALAAAALAIGALSVSAPTVMAYGTPLPCASRSEAAVFAPWGDKATYFRVSNGGFEAGSNYWALRNGAAVVTGNEPYHIGGASDSHSLRLTAGSSAESRTLCVSVGEDGLRFMVYNPKVSGAILHVDAIAQNTSTGAKGYMAFDVNSDVPSAPWSPSMRLGLPKMFNGGGTQALTLVFSTRGTAATWLVDDVYLDPFKSW